jgi:2-aminobenzoate-CoA ligase
MGRIPDHYLPPEKLWPEYVVPEEFSDTPTRINLADFLLDRHIREGRGKNPALKFQDRVMSYSELQILVNRFGNALIEAGVEPRDRVGIRMNNTPAAIVSILAIEKVGAVPVPTSPLWTAREVAYVIDNAEMKFLIASAHLEEQFQSAKALITGRTRGIIAGEDRKQIRAGGDLVFDDLLDSGGPDLDPVFLDGGDIAVILYTSGTTGMPKGCVHFLRQTVIETRMVNKYVYKIGPGDTLGGASPVSFAAGFGTLTLMPFEGGGAISLSPRFAPREMLESISSHNVTVVTGLPIIYHTLAKVPEFRKFDLSPVRIFTSGGDTLGSETLERWKALTGKPIWEGLGSTETLHLVFSNTMNPEPVPKSVGKPLPGVKARITNPQGRECRAGEAGSLCIKAPSGILYWKPYESCNRLLELQRMSVRDGWNLTGDAVYRGTRGNFYFASREDDMIKTSGYRVSPVEIEEVIASHPAVTDVCVIGITDPTRGQIPKALVVVREGVIEAVLREELRELMKQRLAAYKLPRQIEFRKKLPRTAGGKLQRWMFRQVAKI